MSVEATVWAWRSNPENPTDKLVLLCLADHADDRGMNCWPGQARISAKTGLARPTVSISLSRLRDNGFIKVEKIPVSADSSFVKNYYTLNILEQSDVSNANIRVRQAYTAGKAGLPAPVRQAYNNSSLTTKELPPAKPVPRKRQKPLDMINGWRKENSAQTAVVDLVGAMLLEK